MKYRLGKIVILFSCILILAACGNGSGNGKGDFYEAKWGMSIDEVLASGSLNGVPVGEEDVRGADYHSTIEVEGVNAYGHEVVAEYGFRDEVPKVMLFNFDESDDYEGDDLYQNVYFSDTIFVYGQYYFEDLGEDDVEEIVKALEKEYGKPFSVSDESSRWDSKRALITFNHNSDTLEIKARYHTVKDYIVD